MKPIFAVISPGAMGAGIGGRLAERGAEVRTWLAGRSADSAARARDANMIAVEPARIAEASIILSIIPPGTALALAERLTPALSDAAVKPVFVDCNAVSPGTVTRIAAAVGRTGCPFVDGGIIGGPPTPGKAPALYVSGPHAASVATLKDYGLDIRVMDREIGAASALKMSYAGITKGLTALGSVMALAAAHGGVAEELHRELADSQPALLNWLSRQVPRMYSKAYRWVAEMDEIADYIGDRDAGSRILEGAARFYHRIAADMDGERRETGRLTAFFETSNRGE
ncbi:MAG: NAD(P)-dependent oxidoreductase [Acetobacteraceae bacterium]|nr:NAD(P)-dependent oxidoreductase [Acetobacteraceae bacterium]